MRRLPQTKIIATVGPSSSSEERLDQLFETGADIFRFNFSHGTYAEHAERHRIIAKLGAKHRRTIGVIADLQGPKLRIGPFAKGPVELKKGDAFRLDLDVALGDNRRVALPHPEIFEALRPGDILLLDDGKIRLEVTACGATFADTRVAVGGPISDRKGVNLPNVTLASSPLTPKDRDDLEFALGLGITLVALSFVQRPEDVAEAKDVIADRARLIVKLEKPSAIEHLNTIIDLCDGAMVARGDLGVEMAPEEVPVLQRRIVRTCRAAGKPVIVATQMLESMIRSPSPTRAEASDVATAVYEGVDAVMLSAETAAGAHPVEAVTIMDRIIRRVESDDAYRELVKADRPRHAPSASDAITAAACQAAETLRAAAIVTFTTGGSTTVRAARERPTVPILALTPESRTAHALTLVWGVHAVRVERQASFEGIITEAVRRAVEEGFAKPGERLVVTAGLPLDVPGKTNVLRIVPVEEGGGQ